MFTGFSIAIILIPFPVHMVHIKHTHIETSLVWMRSHFRTHIYIYIYIYTCIHFGDHRMVVFSINKYVWISPHYCWLNPNRPSFVLVKRDLPYNVGPPNDSKVCEHNSQKTMRYLEQFVFLFKNF